MSEVKTARLEIGSLVKSRLRDYAQLTKLRLSLLVIFSSAIGFLVAAQPGWTTAELLLFLLAGFFVTAASNALNQVIEKDFDKLMNRTMLRPLPAERMGVMEALLVAGLLAVAGISIFLIYFNQLAAILSSLALLSYAFIYTPLKRFSPFAVFVGAVPGALPPLIGVVAAGGVFSDIGWALFAIQFMWQFPHFWAVAWVAYDDYAKAGYFLLPSREGRTRFSALQTVLYALVLVPVSLLPSWIGFSGWIAALICLVCGLIFLFQAWQLYRQCSVPSARKLMFGSFFYLPAVLLAIYLDRI